jgi:Phosphoesterase family
MRRMPGFLQRAIEAAASLTGKRFGLLVASSLVATSGIVAVGLSGASGLGPVAGLLSRSLAASGAPTETALAPSPVSAPRGGGGGSAPESSAPALPSAAPAPAAESSPLPPVPPPVREETPPAAPGPELPQAGRIKHVFLVNLASPGYEASFGAASQMPYLANTLRPQGALFSGYALLDEAALPNAIAAVSGQPPNERTEADCPTYDEFPANAQADARGAIAGEGCVYPVETLTLADQLGSGRFTWHAYLEGMVDEAGKPANCVHPDAGAAETATPSSYSARMNPFGFFHSLLDLGDCATNDVPLDQLQTDLRKPETTPNFSYVAPTPCTAGFPGQCSEGAPSGAAAADAFLAETVPQILASPAYKEDGLLIVAFGAAPPAVPTDPAATATPPAASDLKVGALLVSPFVTPGSTDASPYDPYALLRSIEDLFGLGHLALADGAKVRSFAPALLAENGGD